MSEKPIIFDGKIELTALASPKWFTSLKESSIWVRIYTSLGIPHKDFRATIDGSLRGVDWGYLLAFSYGQLSNMKIPECQTDIIASEDGSHSITFDIKNRELKKSNYVIFSTPFRIDGQKGDESLTKERLDRVSSIICLHMGLNFLRDIVLDGEIAMATRELTVSTDSTKVPQPVEGPFIHKRNWEDMEKIVQRLNLTQKEIRKRIELSLDLFDKAQREKESFIYYWMSLEILCNGTSQAIRSKLQKLYRLSNVKEVDLDLGFRKISEWRHGYVHSGRRILLDADVERYIQLMFLDLLRQELNLPPYYYLSDIQKIPGYNLSSLGLPDNRKKEDKNTENKK